MFRRFVMMAVIGTCFNAISVEAAQIVVPRRASDKESYAASELQRYLYQLTGQLLPISNDSARINETAIFVGRAGNHSHIDALVENGEITVSADDPGPQGYVLKNTTYRNYPVLVIAGSDDVGVMYGVYGLLDEHYEVSFSFTGSVVPGTKREFYLPQVDERKAPSVEIRGILPWTNFPQSATVYSMEDYKFIIDQMAKMRMNFLHIHNYNGMLTHNEPFHNFELEGFMSRVWMPTARTGHAWAGPAWDVNEYLFGAADLFGDYDFGSDVGLYNDNLSNREVFSKGVTLFQKVIDYAHSRGVRVGLGLDIDLIPDEYNAKACDPAVVEARVTQLTRDYPNLDYLICFQSETGAHEAEKQEFFERWRNIFMGFYDGYKQQNLPTRLAVAGWGLDPESIATLPPDVIAGPIAPYSAGFETGEIYGDREYWGCPWLERDFNSSQYYYPYTMDLQDTIDSYQQRAPNMTGLYTLTWRLADAVEPRMIYIAKAPWDDQNRYSTSRDVYHEFASRHFGAEFADKITDILDGNEPYACDMGECAPTPEFTGATRLDFANEYLMNILTFAFFMGEQEVVTINAADYASQQGVQKAPSGQNGECVGHINSGDWIGYTEVDFGDGADRVVVRAASDTHGGDIELRISSHHGTRLGEHTISNTGGWLNWQDFEFSIDEVSGIQNLYIMFLPPEVNDLPKAIDQVEILDNMIASADDPGNKRRLGELRCRIAAARDFIQLQHTFLELDWSQMPGQFPSWVRNFTHRVNDISSLGNVQSIQNRFIQLRYLPRLQELRNQHEVLPPCNVVARGTKDGAVISWTNKQDSVSGFNVYRDGQRINEQPLPQYARSFTDTADGVFTYVVTAIDNEIDGRESRPSLAAVCAAGNAENEPPHIVVISPPVSVAADQPLEVKARILDGRTYESISAELYYRTMGGKNWKSLPMERRTKAVFCGLIPPTEISPAGIEYYIRASDGTNSSVFPATADEVALTAVVYGTGQEQPGRPGRISVEGRSINWQGHNDQEAHWYRIYRSNTSDFVPSAANFLSYVGGDTERFEDLGLDFKGRRLNGKWYYRVTAVCRQGHESQATESVSVVW